MSQDWGGVRQLIILYMPLGLTCAIIVLKLIFGTDRISAKRRNIVEYIWVYGSVCIASLVGYMVNAKILAVYYDFHLWSGIDTERNWKTISFDSIETYIGGVLNCFGFPAGKISLWGALSVVASLGWLIWTIYSLIKEIRDADEKKVNWRFCVFASCDYLILFLIYVLTDMWYEERYLLPVTVLSLLLVAVRYTSWKHNGRSNVLVVMLLVLTFASMPGKYLEIVNTDRTKYLRLIEEHLSESGIVNGYAPFWCGNILTELSNGEIDVWVWASHAGDTNKISDIVSPRPWLQLKSHTTDKPTGKVFLLMDAEGYYDIPGREVLEVLPYWDVGGEYYLWEFESYETMIRQLGI